MPDISCSSMWYWKYARNYVHGLCTWFFYVGRSQISIDNDHIFENYFTMCDFPSASLETWNPFHKRIITWWRHQMETFSALRTICAGNSPVTGEIPAQRPVTRSFDGFFYLRLNKRLSKQSWDWWFGTPSRPLWRHRNVNSLIHALSSVNHC